jgi:hypothetical protein
MIKLIAVLDRLLALLQGWVARVEHRKAQEERDALNKNPADWFDSHFSSGVHTNNPDKTDQTNT